jgi:hypothetical protein
MLWETSNRCLCYCNNILSFFIQTTEDPTVKCYTCSTGFLYLPILLIVTDFYTLFKIITVSTFLIKNIYDYVLRGVKILSS